MRRVVELGSLSDEDLSLFVRLFDHRRSLPVYRGPSWRCYQCQFESADLETMTTHIMRTHKPAPLTDDEIIDGISLEEVG